MKTNPQHNFLAARFGNPIRAFLLAGAAALLSSCAGLEVFDFKSIDAQVVDADTGAPIEGAIVVANWQLIGGTLDGPRNRGTLDAKETLTDKDGRFHFDAFTKRNPTSYDLYNQDPKIVIFKPGYQRFVHRNNYPADRHMNPVGYVRASQLDGQKVKLKKFSGDTGEYGFSLGSLAIEIQFAYEEQNCWWKKTPLMILAIDSESRRLIKSGIPYGRRIHQVNGGACGDPAAFFKELAK